MKEHGKAKGNMQYSCFPLTRRKDILSRLQGQWLDIYCSAKELLVLCEFIRRLLLCAYLALLGDTRDGVELIRTAGRTFRLSLLLTAA